MGSELQKLLGLLTGPGSTKAAALMLSEELDAQRLWLQIRKVGAHAPAQPVVPEAEEQRTKQRAQMRFLGSVDEDHLR
jgi:hypothetical protein